MDTCPSPTQRNQPLGHKTISYEESNTSMRYEESNASMRYEESYTGMRYEESYPSDLCRLSCTSSSTLEAFKSRRSSATIGRRLNVQ